jgi:hypothetical protein
MSMLVSKKGMSLPAMLAIVFFLIGSVIALITISYQRAYLVEKSIDASEEYVNTSKKIIAVQSIIARDQITDEAEIQALVDYFDISYSKPNDVVYRFYKDLDEVSRTLSGYLATATSVVNTYDEVFTYTGVEDTFELSPMINATSMLADYTNEYLSQNFPSLTIDGDFSTFDLIVDYYRSLTNDYYQLEDPDYIEDTFYSVIDNYIFIDGDVELEDQNLIVEEGFLLVIDGDLEVDGDVLIEGNIIINGDFEIDGGRRDDRDINGTFYVNGDVEVARNTRLGTEERPSFFIVTEDVEFENQIEANAFFIADYFEGQQGRNFITGGVYTFDEDSKINENNIEPNENISSEDLYDLGVSSTIAVESSSGELTFTYTEPYYE